MSETGFDSRIRPIDIRRDLPSIADLIEISFADHMDAEGRDYLRHIRQIARGVGGFILGGNTPESSPLPFQGYVWEENGIIIGNLTLISVRKRYRNTYFIANVAVSPNQRGKGIASQLTRRAIAHVTERDGKRIFLQVRSDNPDAIHIYLRAGFEEFSRRTSWIFTDGICRPGNLGAGVEISRRKKTDWEQQKVWLEQIYPPDISWNMPYNLERLRPDIWVWLDNLMNAVVCRSWSAREGGQLIGSASYESGFSGSDYIWLASSPVWEDRVICALMPHIQTRVSKPQRVTVNYPAGRGREGFTSCGMREQHTLIWMELDLTTRDTSPE